MTTNTKLCLIVAVLFSAQLNSCKKDNSSIVTPLNAESEENSIIDSTTDSSLRKGLVAWYTFNGDVLDHSGNNNHVIFNSANPARGKSGLPKTAYVFDGVSSYMEIKNSTSLNPGKKITLYALVKPTGFYQGKCHWNRIINKGNDDYANGLYVLGFSDQAYYNWDACYMPVQNNFQNFTAGYGDGQNGSGVTDTNHYVKTGQWYSLVYTFDGMISKLYINGVLANKLSKTTPFNPNAHSLFIGRTANPQYPYYLKGVVDEIRIYKRALTAREVKKLYNLR